MRGEKQSIIEEIRASLTESSFVILTDYRGMKAGQANELRRRLSGEKARLQVVKNSLFLRAVDEDVREEMCCDLSGPVAIVAGRGDLVSVSKLLKAFGREHGSPAIRTGVWQGRVLSAIDLELLVSLPPKPVLQGIALGLIAAPMRQLAGVMRRRIESLLYVLRAVEDKKGGGEKDHD